MSGAAQAGAAQAAQLPTREENSEQPVDPDHCLLPPTPNEISELPLGADARAQAELEVDAELRSRASTVDYSEASCLLPPTPAQMDDLPAGVDTAIAAEMAAERQQAATLQSLFALPQTEIPIDDFSCAKQVGIWLLHGRMYVTPEHVCFDSNVFGVVTRVALPLVDVVEIREAAHHLINQAIVVVCAAAGPSGDATREEHLFASFFNRDQAHRIVREVWRIRRRRGARRTSPRLPPPAAPPAAAPARPPSPAPAAAGGAAAGAVTATPLAHELLRLRLPCSASAAHAALLADGSEFLATFLRAQGGRDVSVGAWTPFAPGCRAREVRFVQAVRSRLCPVRTTRVHEMQRAAATDDGGVVVQTVQMNDAPYGDTYTVDCKWRIAPDDDGEGDATALAGCTLVVTTEVTFSRSLWLLEGQIRSGAIAEARQNFGALAPIALAAVAEHTGASLSPRTRTRGAAAAPPPGGVVDAAVRLAVAALLPLTAAASLLSHARALLRVFFLGAASPPRGSGVLVGSAPSASRLALYALSELLAWGLSWLRAAAGM